MTPDEWAAYWRHCDMTPREIYQTTGFIIVEAEKIEHPAIVGYFDHLYAQELGIAYP